MDLEKSREREKSNKVVVVREAVASQTTDLETKDEGV